MPELPEVEVLVRRLAPFLIGRRIECVTVYRERIVHPSTPNELADALRGRRIVSVRRRAKYLVFELGLARRESLSTLLGHLGMTGRLHVWPKRQSLPKHTAVVFHFSTFDLVFEDARCFGRFVLGTGPLRKLGPEPLDSATTSRLLLPGLRRSRQPVKLRLLDQSWIAGVGNIYAAEALYRAGIDPARPARSLGVLELQRLLRSIRVVLRQAIRRGSSIPAVAGGHSARPDFFYHGRQPVESDRAPRFRVYDREDLPCYRCRTPIQRIAQAGRSTYFCPTCQT